MTNNICHYGVLGMKWGVRMKQLSKDDIANAKKMAEEGSKLSNDLQRAINRPSTNRSKKRLDLSSMSDNELRDKISRELLERQYNDVFNAKQTSKGRTYVQKTLEVAGDVLAATGTALGIALAIKELKG